MCSRIQQALAIAVLTICVGAPVLEMFDHWDHTFQNGNDTEANLVVAAVCVGIGFVAAAAVGRRIRPTEIYRLISRILTSVPGMGALQLIFPAFPANGPPTPLRI